MATYKVAGGQPDLAEEPAKLTWRSTTTNLHVTTITVIICCFVWKKRLEAMALFCFHNPTETMTSW